MVENWPPKIEKGIKSQRHNSRWEFIDQMEINDSFFVPHMSTKKAGAYIYHRAAKCGFRFECHNWVEDGVKGVRIWRKS